MVSMLMIVLGSAALLGIAYVTYGRLLARLLGVNSDVPTPANTLRDDIDYAPIDSGPLLSQHFSAIAAAGPIVGPILAGVMFGWLPALLWILIGGIFIGGLHDFASLVASIRHKARSIAEVVREHISQRAFVLFLTFVWLALVYIIVAFTDITAGSFVGQQTLENGEVVSGAGIASASLMYLVLPIIMALAMRYLKLPLSWATIIFLPLVGLSIWAGQMFPVDLTAAVQWYSPGLSPEEAQRTAHISWDILLLIYCAVASVVPMWLLLQPRGHLGGYFLYVALFGGALGLAFSNDAITYPAFKGWEVVTQGGTQTLFPVLFITIACGACSGFHSLIASGTTSKQLNREGDARLIGYGAMLLESLVAIVSLCCVMRLTADSSLIASKPNLIYATGIGSFLKALGLPVALGVSFALMAFSTFVYDTLDVCTRLGRYIVQELTGWQGAAGKWLGTGLTTAIPIFFVMQRVKNAEGKDVELWSVFWNLFGASNQLLAALTLLGITVWLWRTKHAWWVWLVAGVPAALMYVMSSWALVRMMLAGFRKVGALQDAGKSVPVVEYAVLGISGLLLGLAVLMLVEAVLALSRPANGNPGLRVEPALA